MMKMLINSSQVGASALGAIKIMLFALKQTIINRAEDGRFYIAIDNILNSYVFYKVQTHRFTRL